MNPHRKIGSNINSHYYYLGEKLKSRKTSQKFEQSTQYPISMPLGLCLGKPESSERPGTLQNLPWCITCLSLFGSPIEMAHKLRSSGEFCIDYVDYTQMFHHLWVLLERIIKGLPKQSNWWCRFNLMLWKKPASWDTLASRSRPQKEILSYFTMPSTFNQFCPEASSSERLNPNLYCDGKAVWWRGSQRVNECSGAGCFETWMENPNRSD